MSKNWENRVLKAKIASLRRKACCDTKSVTTVVISLDGVVVDTIEVPTLGDKTINITLQ